MNNIGTLAQVTASTGGANSLLTDWGVGVLESVLPATPEVREVPGKVIAGTEYKLVRASNPPRGGFRTPSAGVEAGQATWSTSTVSCKRFDNPIIIDKAIADAFDQGADAWKTLQASQTLLGSFITLGNEFYNGAGANGLTGLSQKAFKTIDAGGTGDKLSSAYIFLHSQQGVQWVFGNGQGLDVSPFVEQLIFDQDGKAFPGSVANLGLWVGLQYGYSQSVIRIANLDTAGHGLNDKLIAQALSYMPPALRADKAQLKISANPDQLFELQKSRTATFSHNSGALAAPYVSGAVAALPTESFNIAILETTSIESGEVEVTGENIASGTLVGVEE